MSPATTKSAVKAPRGSKKGAGKSGDDYTAKNLAVLEGLDAVRKRPGMYIGSTDSRGLMQCLWEIIDNAVDEALAGYCHEVIVNLGADGSVEVKDDGRGIPVDIEAKTGLTGVELVMTKLHAGGKFGGGSYAASGGLHGVGASVVNALAIRMDVAVARDGALHTISFQRGVPGTFDKATPDAKFSKGTSSKNLKKGAKVGKKASGTTIKYWSDPQIFLREADYDIEEIHARARQTAFLVPGLTLIVNDNRTLVATSEKFHFTGGISEYCTILQPDTAICDVIRLKGSGHYQETVPVLDDHGHLVPTDVERDMEVDIALRWGDGYDSTLRSFVNIISTSKGGTHVSGFERGITKVVSDTLKSSRITKASDPDIIKDDVLEGLTAVVTVRMSEPQFEGQTKEILGTAAATKIVQSVVVSELTRYFNARGSKAQSRVVLEKIAGAAKTRVSVRAHKDIQRRKNALESSSLPAKLSDCRSDDIEHTELFIVEGDSALGTAKSARNSEYQALLPIRGKILNVQKASLSAMLDNSECASIIQVIGAGSGRSFNLEEARYGRIILMSDADVDGAHIRCLILPLLFKYMRPLIDEGRVFAAVPPLHRIEISGAKKGDFHYTYSDDEMKKYLASLTKAGKKWREPIQRYKGLGEMDAEQLRETTMDPNKRTLRRITIKDGAQAEKIFELLMGNEVGPRRDFIGTNQIDLERIDL
ncbi:MAG: type IIA DNA topoisomerase subunit B [Actinomycetota bacterium]